MFDKYGITYVFNAWSWLVANTNIPLIVIKFTSEGPNCDICNVVKLCIYDGV